MLWQYFVLDTRGFTLTPTSSIATNFCSMDYDCCSCFQLLPRVLLVADSTSPLVLSLHVVICMSCCLFRWSRTMRRPPAWSRPRCSHVSRGSSSAAPRCITNRVDESYHRDETAARHNTAYQTPCAPCRTPGVSQATAPWMR